VTRLRDAIACGTYDPDTHLEELLDALLRVLDAGCPPRRRGA
jgi:hypothetical protein